jgi:chromosome segregation ATPase
MSADDELMQKRCALLGLDPLSPAAMSAGRRKSNPDQERELARAARATGVAALEDVAQLRAELATLRAERDQLIAELNERQKTINHNFHVFDERADDQEDDVRQLRTEIAGLNIKLAEARSEMQATLQAHRDAAAKLMVDTFNQATTWREESMRAEAARREEVIELRSEITALRVMSAETRVEGLQSLQSNLVAAVKMAVDVSNRVTDFNTRRAEVAQSEQAQREELAALQARADALADELQRIKSHEGFRFAREVDDMLELDLPSFLPPPRRN